MNAEIGVRRGRESDRPAIVGLERHFPSDRLSARSVRRFLRSRSARVLVAASGSGIAGALVLLTRRNSAAARIYSLVVDPRSRGRGVGQRLVRAAEREAARRRCVEVRLEVRAGSRAARALYRKLGYAETARVPDYYDDGAAALRLRKRLR